MPNDGVLAPPPQKKLKPCCWGCCCHCCCCCLLLLFVVVVLARLGDGIGQKEVCGKGELGRYLDCKISTADLSQELLKG